MSNPYKNSKDGRFVSKEYVEENRDTTYTMSRRNNNVRTSNTFDKDLRTIVNGLYILSESDYPLEVIDKEFLRIEPMTVFINSQIANQPEYTEQFNKIKESLKDNLDEVLVFIIGKETLKTILIIGKDEDGFYRGLYSFVVET